MSDDWQRHLPPEAREEMAAELAGTPPEHLAAVTAAWRSTAEVYADPEVLAALTRDLSDEPEPIEIQPTAMQRARWETAAEACGQTLEEFLIAAANARVEETAYARAMRARKRGSADD
jgi:hypothetical protein